MTGQKTMNMEPSEQVVTIIIVAIALLCCTETGTGTQTGTETGTRNNFFQKFKGGFDN